jgi:hypothetical protein
MAHNWPTITPWFFWVKVDKKRKPNEFISPRFSCQSHPLSQNNSETKIEILAEANQALAADAKKQRG